MGRTVISAESTDAGHAERLLQVGRSLTSNLDLESLLREITLAARDLTGASYAALGVLNSSRDGLARFITSGISPEVEVAIGDLPRGRGVLGVLIADPRPLRMSRLSDHPDAYGFPKHHPEMESFLGVPILIGNTAYGNLYLTNKPDGQFTDRDEDSVMTLASWAAIAISNARAAKDDRLRAAIDGSENERRRWARELHDETLQSLGALHFMLAAALRSGDRESLESAARDGVEQLRLEITNLRSLLTELRPPTLDELGLATALSGLAKRMTDLADVDVALTSDLEHEDDLPDDLKLTIYRIVQEGVSNAVKHASPSQISIDVSEFDGSIRVIVNDDGDGFDPTRSTDGFGLTGMRERVALSSGTMSIDSSIGNGTRLTAALPIAALD
jgi:signal transduction histidine kinase